MTKLKRNATGSTHCSAFVDPEPSLKPEDSCYHYRNSENRLPLVGFPFQTFPVLFSKNMGANCNVIFKTDGKDGKVSLQRSTKLQSHFSFSA